MGMFYRRLLETGGNSVAMASQSISDESRFDANMVIVLVVLLCALILTLGLNTISRCGLRYLISRSLTEQSTPGGLKKPALRKLPVDLYGSGSGPDISVTECTICLGEFVDGERVRVLPKCSHSFHVACIDTWLVSNASCPNCRVSLLDHPPPPPPHPVLPS